MQPKPCQAAKQAGPYLLCALGKRHTHAEKVYQSCSLSMGHNLSVRQYETLKPTVMVPGSCDPPDKKKAGYEAACW